MKTKNIILQLRKERGMSQDELADKIMVTRQAVSRWENCDTVPNIDTLKLLSKEFDVSINTLLGEPRKLICQCCGMPIDDDSILGRDKDGTLNEEYCKWCYADGTYTYNDMDEQAIYSDTLMIRNEHAGETLALKGYTRLSAAAVFGMSDQRLPAGLMAAAILWAIGSMLYLRKREKENLVLQPVGGCRQPAEDGTQSAEDFGGLTYSDADDRFYGADHTPIRFTPMQQQLMRLFWQSPSHSISKEEICAALWPKKDDANDTLYTLIRRLKPIVEEHTRLKIVADRGRNYSLEINELKS